MNANRVASGKRTQEGERTKTVLAVDVGNTATRFGLLLDGVLAASWEFTTRPAMTADEARLEIANFFFMLARDERKGGASAEDAGDGRSASFRALGTGGEEAHLASPDDAILSSVVPDLTDVWVRALAIECGRKPFVVGPGLKTGLKMHYNDPSEVGSDRVATLVAAREAYGYPLIVIDFGTTTNFDVLDSSGAFAGGVIAPGIALSARSLARAAARLPVIEIKVPASVIGKNTREAMQAGVVLGEVARIDGLVDAIWAELGCTTKVIATGAQASTVCALSEKIESADESLVLRGLGILYALNAQR